MPSPVLERAKIITHAEAPKFYQKCCNVDWNQVLALKHSVTVNTGHSLMVVVFAEGVANVIYAYLDSVDIQGTHADSRTQVRKWTVRPISVTMGFFNHGFELNTHTASPFVWTRSLCSQAEKKITL